jgi:hypothetical protein
MRAGRHEKGTPTLTTHLPDDPTVVDGVDAFLAKVAAALTEQAQGHPEPFLALWSHTADVALMAAVGGYETGYDDVSATLTEASKAQNFQSREAKRLLAHFTEDFGVTVEIETLKRQIDGKPADMTLRAAQVYRRVNGEWKVIHRHGDRLETVGVKW